MRFSRLEGAKYEVQEDVRAEDSQYNSVRLSNHSRLHAWNERLIGAQGPSSTAILNYETLRVLV
jgi:hypothetical protein